MKIELIDVWFRYDTLANDWALKDINLKLSEGEKVVIVGPAGSGKTTLIQLLDALILPTKGDILFDGISVGALSKKKKLSTIRRRTGLLFQFPEHQFFQESAYEEICFGVKNFFDLDNDKIESMVKDLLASFGMDIDMIKRVSPFNLSSGEKRKLALASVIIMSPEFLILDEPTAGLDAPGRHELIKIISSLKDTSVIVVTHNLDDFLGIADRVIGLSKGCKVLDVQKEETINFLQTMEDNDIMPPLVIQIQRWLLDKGIHLDQSYWEMEDLVTRLKQELGIYPNGDSGITELVSFKDKKH